MTSEEEFIVRCYRTSLEDVGTPELDEQILAAAHRRVVHRRVLRVSGGAIALAAMVLVVIHVTRAHAPSSEVTNYGSIEGVTRAYLLQVQAPAYDRPGMNEGR